MLLSQIMHKRIITFIVSLALVMDSLDTTIINTAIPAMSRSLQVNPVDLKIALISYLLSLAILIPISGWIGDKYGVKRVFISALVIFTLSSFWCGYATTLWELVIARTIQGLGGSLMLPLGRLIILRAHERHEFVDAMSRVIMIVSLGLMLGPALGGFITDHLSWHWIFWVNIPVGLFAIILSLYALKDTAPRIVSPFDTLGFIYFGLGLAGLTFSLSYLSESTAYKTRSLTIMLISVILLISYRIHSRRQKHPIVKTKLFRYRTFQVSVMGNLFSRLGFGGVPFLLPLLLQVGLGYSAQLSGILLGPIALGIIMIKLISLRLLRLIGYKKLLAWNTIMVGISLWTFTTIGSNTSIYLIGLLTFLFGLLISLQYSCMNSLAYSEIVSDDLSAATSIMSTTQQLAQSFGVAVGALLLRFFTPASTPGFLLTPSVFHHVFEAMGIITLFSIFIFIRLKPEDGQQMLTKPATG